MQKRITSAATVKKAKQALFEAHARTMGVYHILQHYHADNGRFADNAFIADVARCKQSSILYYCAANAHFFKNGVSENRVSRDLQDRARTFILHAKLRWPKAIEASSLWPYALRHVNDSDNSTIEGGQTESRVERFAQLNVRPKILRHFHPFGCPAYVLVNLRKNQLQSGKSLPKWESRYRHIR